MAHLRCGNFFSVLKMIGPPEHRWHVVYRNILPDRGYRWNIPNLSPNFPGGRDSLPPRWWCWSNGKFRKTRSGELTSQSSTVSSQAFQANSRQSLHPSQTTQPSGVVHRRPKELCVGRFRAHQVSRTQENFEMLRSVLCLAVAAFAFGSANSADAGLFFRSSGCGCAAPAPACGGCEVETSCCKVKRVKKRKSRGCCEPTSCCEAAPSCAAPAPACCAPAPTCAAPAPACCAPVAPSCAAPVAPSCAAPAGEYAPAAPAPAAAPAEAPAPPTEDAPPKPQA